MVKFLSLMLMPSPAALRRASDDYSAATLAASKAFFSSEFFVSSVAAIVCIPNYLFHAAKRPPLLCRR
jgi:hypothetical protein